MKSVKILLVLLLPAVLRGAYAQKQPVLHVVNMVFTSDAHYGLTRPTFRGDTNVNGHNVNGAMIMQMGTLPNLVLRADSGVNSGNKVGGIDYLVQGGDIANRMEGGVQTAAASWAQFETDYLHNHKLKGHNGKPVKVLMVPGNHDISNATHESFNRPYGDGEDL